MHLYLVQRKGDVFNDEYDALLVAAPSPHRARLEVFEAVSQEGHDATPFASAQNSKVTDIGVGKGPVRIILSSKGTLSRA